MTRPKSLLSLSLLVLPILRLDFAKAYPLIGHVEERSERCFRFSIPRGDDASFVLVPLIIEDAGDQEPMEKWFVEQTHNLIKNKDSSGRIPAYWPEKSATPPENVAKLIQEAMTKHEASPHSGTATLVKVYSQSVGAEQITKVAEMNARFFVPAVSNLLREASQTAMSAEEDVDELEHQVCFFNPDPDHGMEVVFDVVLKSEEFSDGPNFKETHLTPLEMSLGHSLDAARTVIKEMDYLEQRERRMRETADSINQRVRYFSYLSVGTLLAVTYIQVNYLKRYFRKKKLM